MLFLWELSALHYDFQDVTPLCWRGWVTYCTDVQYSTSVLPYNKNWVNLYIASFNSSLKTIALYIYNLYYFPIDNSFWNSVCSACVNYIFGVKAEVERLEGGPHFPKATNTVATAAIDTVSCHTVLTCFLLLNGSHLLISCILFYTTDCDVSGEWLLESVYT